MSAYERALARFKQKYGWPPLAVKDRSDDEQIDLEVAGVAKAAGAVQRVTTASPDSSGKDRPE